MKGIATAICCALLSGATWVEIRVTKRGRSAAGVSVTFNDDSRPGASPYWRGVTDANGRLFPPKLARGKYWIFADADRRKAELYIDVSSVNNERAKIEMKLTIPRIGDAEDSPIAVRVKEFHGIVLDPSGSVLPQADIQVLDRDNLDAGAVLKIQSDSAGHFSAHLEKGTYVAIFHSPGFKSFVSVFEVTEKGDAELRITLQVGGVA